MPSSCWSRSTKSKQGEAHTTLSQQEAPHPGEPLCAACQRTRRCKSSKGNLEKWQEAGRWYKVDQFGYEALAEAAVSALLEQSNMLLTDKLKSA